MCLDSFARARRPHGLYRFALALSLAFLVVTAAAADEFKVIPDPPEPEILEPDDTTPGPPWSPRVFLSVGAKILREDDMSDTYGTLPDFGLGLSLPLAPQTFAFLTVNYQTGTGDPFYDHPDFSGVETRLRALPVSLGFMVDASSYQDFSAYLGLGFQVAWIQEKVPDQDVISSTDLVAYDNFGHGFVMFFAPEWRPGGGPLGIGLKLGWGGTEARVSASGSSRHDVNLVGYQAGAYVSWGL